MRHIFFKALLIPALLTSALALNPAAAASAASVPAQVYFANDSAAPGFLNVYVDGALTAATISVGSNMMFPKSVTTGDHTAVVTRSGEAPGTADIFSVKVNIPAAGTYTLTLDNDTHTLSGFQSGYAFDLTSGSPDGQ